MNHIIGTPLRWTITTYGDSGEPVDADAVPTVALRINQASTAQSVSITKRASAMGLYDASATLTGLSEGDHIEALATVAIDSTEYQHAYQWRVASNMRGTDGALTTLGSTAPANWINAAAIASNAISSVKIANGALTSAKFAAGAFDAVWSVASRTLTAVADSAGVATLLERITSRIRTVSESAAADQAIIDEIVSLAPDTEQIVRDILAGLGSVQITRIGPEFDPATSTVTLIAGDDYLVANGSALTFAITLPDIDLANARAVFSAERTYHTLLPGSAELVDTDTDQPKLRLQWTRSQTNTKPNTYAWGVAIIDSQGLVKTVIGGPLILKPAAVNPAVVSKVLEVSG